MRHLTVTARTALRLSCFVSLGFAGSLAWGHGVAEPHAHGAGEAFAAGLAHPLTGVDHLLAMVALGAWSALALRRVVLAPLAFAATMCLGAVLALAGLALPAIEPMIAASLLALGLLLAAGLRLPGGAAALLAAAFALFHGAAHGQELHGPGAAWALLGMLIATALLHAAGIGLGLLLRARGPWPQRLAGASVAAFGGMLLLA